MKIELDFLPNKVIEHVKNQPNATAYTFVYNNKQGSKSISYAELDYKARLLAEIFHKKNLMQERLILLYPTGIEFIVAYLACLYSGAIAIPLNCSNNDSPNKYIPLIVSIVKNANVRAIVTTDYLATIIQQASSTQIQKIDIICTDLIYTKDKVNEFVPVSMLPTMLSHLQYTSGSTSTPRGVICNHENLANSLCETAKIWQYSSKSITVSWAPHSHVYGLIVGLLVPLYSGSQAIIMSANDFLINPISWLNAISHFKATHSGCPNFGYEFCIEQIDDEELKELNLATWQVASNGGESVQLNTLIKFFNKFKAAGFKFESFYPAYGMSECTGLITTRPADSKFSPSYFSRKELQYNHAVEVEQMPQTGKSNIKTQAFVSCGMPIHGLTIKIVNAKTEREVVSNHIGEVWLSGPTCTFGYWHTTDLPVGRFSDDMNVYIKTGDLGFIHKGELFLVGRLKELIILYGKNYYPTDIEMEVKNSNTYFVNNICAAFSALIGENEELFIVQEIEDYFSEQEYLSAISSARKTLSLKYSIDAYAIILVPQHSIPKTASGKLQRKMTSQRYFKKAFNIVYQSIKAPASLL
ncbi:MAG TPA: AMP-binding protein [Gammaproteobacteria bacterium]|nr:AMP-binding protein [Gammaproteobacteria bacterium]